MNTTTPASNYARHFHTFDALRFLAFLKVFLYHIPSVPFGVIANLMSGGTLAVRFFFVLSGFLITYLILAEKLALGRIDFKYFMWRRVLRIWPLYYLIVAFAFATPYLLSVLHLQSSSEGYAPDYRYTLTFLENYVGIVRREAPNVSPLGVIWSICVEEHFYLMWGLILTTLSVRHVPKLLSICVVVAIVSRIVFVALGYATRDLFTNLDLFAAGALPAYLLCINADRFEAFINRVPVWGKKAFIALVVAAVFIDPKLKGAVHDVLGPTVLAVLFSALLTIFLSRTSTLYISDRNVLSRLGKYTYGLYLYHVIVINFLIVMFTRANLQSERLPEGALLALLALGISIAISAASYHVFERPFLSLRRYPAGGGAG